MVGTKRVEPTTVSQVLRNISQVKTMMKTTTNRPHIRTHICTGFTSYLNASQVNLNNNAIGGGYIRGCSPTQSAWQFSILGQSAVQVDRCLPSHCLRSSPSLPSSRTTALLAETTFYLLVAFPTMPRSFHRGMAIILLILMLTIMLTVMLTIIALQHGRAR